MGILEFFKIRRDGPDDLDTIEPLVRGTAYPKDAVAPCRAALAMSELLDPREGMLAFTEQMDGRTAAQFNEMTDPVAVENFLKLLRQERTQ